MLIIEQLRHLFTSVWMKTQCVPSLFGYQHQVCLDHKHQEEIMHEINIKLTLNVTKIVYKIKSSITFLAVKICAGHKNEPMNEMHLSLHAFVKSKKISQTQTKAHV